jgi:SAM-dependent methyltransferase
VPTSIEEHSSLIAQKHAIECRDEMIVAHLKKLRAKSLLDIGCDFGSLVNEAGKNGIISRGIDVDDAIIKLARAADLDVVKYSIEEIVADGSFRAVSIENDCGPSVMSCLNILHGDWGSGDVRDSFLKISLSNFDYVVLTATREWFLQISNEFDLTYIQFIGPANRPIRKSTAHLIQYGSTFFFKGKIHFLENFFWDILLGKWRFPNPIVSYLGLVAIVSIRVNPIAVVNKV